MNLLQTRHIRLLFQRMFGKALFRPGRSFDGAGLGWQKALMYPWYKPEHGHSALSRRKKNAALSSEVVQEHDNRFRLAAAAKNGKVTDCGFDQMACVYTRLPADRDFIFEADILAKRFLFEPAPSGAEAFGIFIRDTMEQEPETGLYYSDMAAVGGYWGRWNIFSRSGITTSDFGHVSNLLMYSKIMHPGGTYENDLLHYRILPEAPLLLHLKLIRRGNEITAAMRDSSGRDLLAPEHNGGPGELTGPSGFLWTDEGYRFTCPDDMFCSRDQEDLFLGFFAARKSEITIPEESIRLTILNISRTAKKSLLKNNPSYPEDEFPESVPIAEDAEEPCRMWYASPDGTAKGKGSPDSPLDIFSAIERCGNNETVFLLPGIYHLREDLLIGPDHSGANGSRRHLLCGNTAEQKAVLDFCGTMHALRISGSFWDITNVRVTNGIGILIEGSYNRIRRCAACRNMNTGIQIRHRRNESPRSIWPSHNLVEDCLSYENRDPSEYEADGFACKVAAGEGNCFRRCISWMNSDDGFDLYEKNRKIGPVLIENCESYLNGYKPGPEGDPAKTIGNGNGFKLGGSGLYTEHQVRGCLAEGNKKHGFTSNSNPYLHLEHCRAHNNRVTNISYNCYEGSKAPKIRKVIDCECSDTDDFDIKELLQKLNKLRDE